MTSNSQASVPSGLPTASFPCPYPYVSWLTNITFVLISAQDIVSRPPTPLLHNRQPGTPSSRPATPRISHGHALHPKAPVQTPEQFYDWLTLIDRSVTHSQDAHFRAHVASLTAHLETCERLINRITEVDHTLAQMYQEWWRVEENGRIVKEGCERLVEERVSPSPHIHPLAHPSVIIRTSCSMSLKISTSTWRTFKSSIVPLECSIIPANPLFSSPTFCTWSSVSMSALPL